jgi:hypothetical protein
MVGAFPENEMHDPVLEPFGQEMSGGYPLNKAVIIEGPKVVAFLFDDDLDLLTLEFDLEEGHFQIETEDYAHEIWLKVGDGP